MLSVQRKYERELEERRKLVELRPRCALERVELAETLRKAGAHEKALAQLNTAGELSPRYPREYRARARLLAKRGQYSDAYAVLREAIEFAPRDVASYMCLSSIARDDRRSKSLARAEAILRNAAEKYEDLPELNAALARLLSATGNDEKALEKARAAQADAPDSLYAQQTVSCLLQTQGRDKEALEAADRVADLARYAPWEYLAPAWAYGWLDADDKARECVEKARKAEIRIPEKLAREYPEEQGES